MISLATLPMLTRHFSYAYFITRHTYAIYAYYCRQLPPPLFTPLQHATLRRRHVYAAAMPPPR